MVLCFSIGLNQAEAKSKNKITAKVNCNKGQSVQKVLNKFLTDKKALRIIIKGTCTNEPRGEVQVKRDNVSFEGNEVVGGHINAPVFVNGARNFRIAENMTLSSLFASSSEITIETEGAVTIENDVFLVRRSSLTIDTESDNGDGIPTVGLVTINGPITVEGHSLLSVQLEASEGEVILNGMLFARLQSSIHLSYATVNDIVLEFDSHALLGEGLTSTNLPDYTYVTCDPQSRAWGESPTEFFFNAVPGTLIGETCKTP